MPHFYPNYADNELPDKIENDGERKMYNAFKCLPDNWEIFHSHRYHRRRQNGRLEEREIDFLILIPGEGILFMEVKGSRGFERIDGRWFRIDQHGKRHETRDPFEQVSSAKHSCIKKLAHLFSNGEFSGKYGQVVAYPNGRYAATTPTAFDKDTILQGQHLHDVESFLLRAIRLWGTKAATLKMSDLKKVSNYLKQDHGFIRVTAADIDEDEQDIKNLTTEQFSTLRKIQNDTPNIAIIKGEAGSGKTLIAKWACETYAKLGKSVLFLCYNKNLSTWINTYFENSEYENVDVFHFHGLCKHAATLSKVAFRVPFDHKDASNFWQEGAPEILLDAIENEHLAKYDVVIVDEGQDFNYFWWSCVTDLVKGYSNGNGMLHVFYDYNQSLYHNGGGSIAEFFESGDPASMTLDKNCRNTKQLVNYCGSAVKREIESFTLSPEGKEPTILKHTSNTNHRRNHLKDQVNILLSEGVAPSGIAILSPFNVSNGNCSFSSIENINGIPLALKDDQLTDWCDNKRIWASTIKSFKGLEADCIILVDIPDYDSESSYFGSEDLYVALTRAKHRLVILPSSEKSELQLKEWLQNS